ncbi:hypothetical protein OPV22_028815 [Ensete ventricosum]|uniref:Late embryogenesis abundant protein LEA-2 subgroup domain-containing protein n=1 Tax=Ensete ventricosum TaxID=4639 RepID=A0AAV8Q9G2_ENSVE|nr:hypothetical protein OPV22_028815 [Ensete ventricosum]
MAESKQSYLNGAYYGPPVPPRDTYRSVGRSSSCCCCGPCCLLCNLVKFIVSIVIALGIVVLVLWLIFRPNDIKVHVDNASLTQFNYTTGTGSLSYNLSLAMSIRNPNKRISIYYDYLEAQASYDGFRFGYAPLLAFYQGRKSTAALDPAFQGAQVVTEDGVAETYARETGEGFYYVDVRVYAKLRLKVWVFKIRYNRPRIDCSLKLPAPGTAGSFEKTRCHVRHF